MAVTERELIAGYRQRSPQPSPVAVAVALETRIAELRRYVRWYAALEPTRRWTWRDLEDKHRAELAALLRLVRRARRIEADRPDPMTAAKAYAELGYHDAQAAYR